MPIFLSFSIMNSYRINFGVIHLRQGKKHEKKENVVGDHDDYDLRVYLVHNLLCTK